MCVCLFGLYIYLNEIIDIKTQLYTDNAEALQYRWKIMSK